MNFDIAIIGGGNAGLSLARNLFRDKTKKKIIVIEPELPDNKVANWCTWMHRDNPALPPPMIAISKFIGT